MTKGSNLITDYQAFGQENTVEFGLMQKESRTK
jgi:hypothetical protein